VAVTVAMLAPAGRAAVRAEEKAGCLAALARVLAAAALGAVTAAVTARLTVPCSARWASVYRLAPLLASETVRILTVQAGQESEVAAVREAVSEATTPCVTAPPPTALAG
jgi:hypothetical protein